MKPHLLPALPDLPLELESDPPHAGPAKAYPPLTRCQWAVLRFEQQWSWRAPESAPAAKQKAIRQLLGLGWAQYFQVLNQVVDHPQAERFDPALVRQLQRLRSLCA